MRKKLTRPAYRRDIPLATKLTPLPLAALLCLMVSPSSPARGTTTSIEDSAALGRAAQIRQVESRHQSEKLADEKNSREGLADSTKVLLQIHTPITPTVEKNSSNDKETLQSTIGDAEVQSSSIETGNPNEVSREADNQTDNRQMIASTSGLLRGAKAGTNQNTAASSSSSATSKHPSRKTRDGYGPIGPDGVQPGDVGGDLSRYMSIMAAEMAVLIDMEHEIRELIKLHQEIDLLTDADEDRVLEPRRRKIDRLALRVSKRVLKTSLEADYVMSEIEYENAHNSYLMSKINERQTRQLRWANRLDAVTNATLWSLSSGLAIPGYKHPRASIPAGTTGILAGAVPAALELGTLQFPNHEKLKRRDTGNMLAFVFNVETGRDYYLPPTVEKYLTSIPPRSNDIRTRRDLLVSSWQESKLIPPRLGPKSDRMIKLLTGTTEKRNYKVTSEILQHKILMLDHLKVTIYAMKRGLFELMNLL